MWFVVGVSDRFLGVKNEDDRSFEPKLDKKIVAAFKTKEAAELYVVKSRCYDYSGNWYKQSSRLASCQSAHIVSSQNTDFVVLAYDGKEHVCFKEDLIIVNPDK